MLGRHKSWKTRDSYFPYFIMGSGKLNTLVRTTYLEATEQEFVWCISSSSYSFYRWEKWSTKWFNAFLIYLDRGRCSRFDSSAFCRAAVDKDSPGTDIFTVLGRLFELKKKIIWTIGIAFCMKICNLSFWGTWLAPSIEHLTRSQVVSLSLMLGVEIT